MHYASATKTVDYSIIVGNAHYVNLLTTFRR